MVNQSKIGFYNSGFLKSILTKTRLLFSTWQFQCQAWTRKNLVNRVYKTKKRWEKKWKESQGAQKMTSQPKTLGQSNYLICQISKHNHPLARTLKQPQGFLGNICNLKWKNERQKSPLMHLIGCSKILMILGYNTNSREKYMTSVLSMDDSYLTEIKEGKIKSQFSTICCILIHTMV